jgi:hypothetical protein
MSPFSEGIRQHDTHSALVGQTGLQGGSLGNLDLDAIIVPASRPASHLDHAVTLARHTGAWLVVLCSQRIHGEQVGEFLATRSFIKSIVIDLPRGYSHELLHFPGLLSLKNDLPPACGSYVTDLSMKRNLGLVLARMLRWRRIFFLDDDIRDISCPDLQNTVNMLGFYSAAGMWVTDYPDNSIVCHANRMTGEFQDVFVSGAAVAVDCDADIGFFPDIYNEDWLFFFDDAASGQLVNSYLKATQLCYYPFANPQRAAWQEFGDVLAEGLYTLLHLGLDVEQATSKYWSRFLEARQDFLEAIIKRSHKAHPDIQADMLTSVLSALKCSLKIEPDLCERYIRLWRQDLINWKQRAVTIPDMPSIEAALQEMRLSLPPPPSSNWKIRRFRDEMAENITARPVTIPRFDTLKEVPEHYSNLHQMTAAPLADERHIRPLSTLEHSAAPLGDRPDHSDATPSPERYRQRFNITIPWLGSLRDTSMRRRNSRSP